MYKLWIFGVFKETAKAASETTRSSSEYTSLSNLLSQIWPEINGDDVETLKKIISTVDALKTSLGNLKQEVNNESNVSMKNFTIALKYSITQSLKKWYQFKNHEDVQAFGLLITILWRKMEDQFNIENVKSATLDWEEFNLHDEGGAVIGKINKEWKILRKESIFWRNILESNDNSFIAPNLEMMQSKEKILLTRQISELSISKKPTFMTGNIPTKMEINENTALAQMQKNIAQIEKWNKKVKGWNTAKSQLTTLTVNETPVLLEWEKPKNEITKEVDINGIKTQISKVEKWNKKVEKWNKNLNILGVADIEKYNTLSSEEKAKVRNQISDALSYNRWPLDDEFVTSIQAALWKTDSEREEAKQQSSELWQEIIDLSDKDIKTMSNLKLNQLYEKFNIADMDKNDNLNIEWYGQLKEKVALIKNLVEKQNKENIKEWYKNTELQSSIAYLRRFPKDKLKALQNITLNYLKNALTSSNLKSVYWPTLEMWADKIADWIAGPMTARAVIQMQKLINTENGLDLNVAVDGKPWNKTLAALWKAINHSDKLKGDDVIMANLGALGITATA